MSVLKSNTAHEAARAGATSGVSGAQAPAGLSRQRQVWLAATAVVLLLAALGVRWATARPTRGPGSPINSFSPDYVAATEQEAWAAYYYHQWPRLFGLLLDLTRSQFGLSPWESLYPTYVATRAQVAFSRHGDAGGDAERYMRQYYEYVKGPAGDQYDPARAAQLEVRWWVVHRHRAEDPDGQALVEALADLDQEVWRIPRAPALAAARFRAQANNLSDEWNRQGRQPDSPLLGQIREALAANYRILKAAVTGDG